MEWTKEEKQLRKRTAESFASLAFSIWTIVLIGYIKSKESGFWADYYTDISWVTYVLIAFGGLCALFGFYLILSNQKSFLLYLERTGTTGFVKVTGWFIALGLFAARLILTGNILLYVTGIVTFIIAFLIFILGIIRK